MQKQVAPDSPVAKPVPLKPLGYDCPQAARLDATSTAIVKKDTRIMQKLPNSALHSMIGNEGIRFNKPCSINWVFRLYRGYVFEVERRAGIDEAGFVLYGVKGLPGE